MPKIITFIALFWDSWIPEVHSLSIDREEFWNMLFELDVNFQVFCFDVIFVNGCSKDFTRIINEEYN